MTALENVNSAIKDTLQAGLDPADVDFYKIVILYKMHDPIC